MSIDTIGVGTGGDTGGGTDGFEIKDRPTRVRTTVPPEDLPVSIPAMPIRSSPGVKIRTPGFNNGGVVTRNIDKFANGGVVTPNIDKFFSGMR